MSDQFLDFDERLYQISDKVSLKQRLQDFFRCREDIRAAYLYGSFATQEVGHDLDVGVFIRGKIDSLRLGTLLERYLFEADIRVPVDLRVLDEAPVWGQYEVIREGTRVYQSSLDEAAAIEAQVILDYLDFQPLIESYDRAFWERFLHEIRG